MKQRHEGKSAGKFGKAMEAYLKALDDLVDSPDPLEGVVDEGSRSVNRCIATAAVVGDLPAVEAARILAHAAAAIEEQPDGDGCLSMLIGEAVRLQAGNPSLELEALERENAYLEGEIDRRHEEIEALAKELAEGQAGPGMDQTELQRQIRNLMKGWGKPGGGRNPSDIH